MYPSSRYPLRKRRNLKVYQNDTVGTDLSQNGNYSQNGKVEVSESPLYVHQMVNSNKILADAVIDVKKAPFSAQELRIMTILCSPEYPNTFRALRILCGLSDSAFHYTAGRLFERQMLAVVSGRRYGKRRQYYLTPSGFEALSAAFPSFQLVPPKYLSEGLPDL